jgi:hypothetical protein
MALDESQVSELEEAIKTYAFLTVAAHFKRF